MPDAKPPEKAAEASKPASPVRPRLIIPPGQEPIYSNVVRIAHTPSEMVFDFGRVLPGESEIVIKTRVMMSPLSAKLLQRALADNLAKYEAVFGEIKIPLGKSLADDLFKSLPHTDPPTKPEGSE